MNEVTGDTLKLLRRTRGLNQDAIAELLGIERAAVSKIETGKRLLSDSEKKLLDWYFFGKLPPHIEGPETSGTKLHFSEVEWRIINILSKWAGFKEPQQWVAAQIHAYLDHHPKAQEAKAAEKKETKAPVKNALAR